VRVNPTFAALMPWTARRATWEEHHRTENTRTATIMRVNPAFAALQRQPLNSMDAVDSEESD
jgi:hypothetical protein